MTRTATCLWYDGQAEPAAEFYTALIPGSWITSRNRAAIDWPNGAVGDVILVEFELAGTPYQALNGGDFTQFTDAASIPVACGDQTELDRIWDALLDGGQPMQCGWLRDRYGMRWQIVPAEFMQMMRGETGPALARAMQAMTRMVKLDMVALRRAFEDS